MTTTARILLVEDEAVVALGLQNRLKQLGHQVLTVTDRGEEAVRLAIQHVPDLILMDINLRGELDGIGAAEQILAKVNIPIVFLTIYGDEQTVRRAARTTPYGYIYKPCKDRDLSTGIEIALQRFQAERRVRESEQRHVATLRSLGDGVVAVDHQGHVTMLNRVAEQMTGWSLAEARGKPVDEVFSLIDERSRRVVENPVKRAGSRDNIVALDPGTRLVRRDGKEVTIEDSVAPIRDSHQGYSNGAVLAFRDVTEKKALETELRQVQKLESLGILAGGIAHDFNNLLTPILGYAAMLPSHLPPGSPALMMVQQIEQAARRLRPELAQQMLAYSGRGTFVVTPIQLSDLVDEMAQLVQVSLSKKARLELKLSRNLPAVEVDSAQIQQVVLNLLTNASESLEDRPGTITVATSSQYYTADELKGDTLQGTLAAGHYVVLQVRDTGCGMTPETLQRIFDPFFTTKFTGRGLGLSAVLGIVRGHKGTIRVQSERGTGTCFELLLPASTKPVAGAPETADLPRVPGASGHILVVEDDVAVRMLVERVLRHHGYRVTLAADGKEGLEQFRRYADELVGVVMDLTMPVFSGAELLPQLRAIRADVPAIVLSGFSETEVRAIFADYRGVSFLPKPFRPRDLLVALQRLTDLATPDFPAI